MLSARYIDGLARFEMLTKYFYICCYALKPCLDKHLSPHFPRKKPRYCALVCFDVSVFLLFLSSTLITYFMRELLFSMGKDTLNVA